MVIHTQINWEGHSCRLIPTAVLCNGYIHVYGHSHPILLTLAVKPEKIHSPQVTQEREIAPFINVLTNY